MTDIRTILEFEEGRRHSAYKCTKGFWTIGVGHRLTDRELEKLDDVLTDQDINRLLDSDIEETVAAAKRYFYWFPKLNEPRQAVILSMIFQLGVIGLNRFVTTLKLIAKGQYEAAADHMLRSLWARQTPARAKRQAEQFRTGKWHNDYINFKIEKNR